MERSGIGGWEAFPLDVCLPRPESYLISFIPNKLFPSGTTFGGTQTNGPMCCAIPPVYETRIV
jgi:hypothetical protein